jgi:Glycosyl hydrolase family 3 C-terminal domain
MRCRYRLRGRPGRTVSDGHGRRRLGYRQPSIAWQAELLQEVIATGTPTIIVMTSGRPFALNGLEDQAAAVLMAFQPGQEGAEAIADLLTGNASPSGRLVVSIPKNVGAVPYYYNQNCFGLPPRKSTDRPSEPDPSCH